MDKHYLTPLFAPKSIVVFAGQVNSPDSLQFLDIHTTGTLADLAQTGADLAIIALPQAKSPPH